MDIITQPEFRVPLDQVKPGMVLSRHLEFKGQRLLNFGTEITEERIERLREFGVSYIHVHFGDFDFEMYKEMICSQDSPPTYERFVELARDTFWEFIPSYARPRQCARSDETAAVVEEIIDHTFDIILTSRTCFELLKMTRFFQVEEVKHSPAAWVFALCVGAGLGYAKPHLLDLSLSSLFYDIGMLKVPRRIVHKPGKLTELEFSEIKKHVFFSRKLLDGLNQVSSTALQVAFEHHEQYYGGGYPRNKRGENVHEFSQIVGLTDKFAALLTSRTYRGAFQPYEAYEMLLAQTKSAVSPKVFVTFLKSVLLYPRGSMLRLSTGEIAEPVSFPMHLPSRPTVRITHTEGGEEIYGRQKVLNLKDHPEIMITAYSVE